jgi:hypothetical protein
LNEPKNPANMRKTSTNLLKSSVALFLLFFSGNVLKAQCNADFTYTVNGLTVTFTNTSTNFTTNAQYSWIFGDASTSSAATPPPHTYAAAGTYTVCLGGADLSPFCADTSCHIITLSGSGINELPEAYGSISNYPNPFSTTTTIDYELHQQGSVQVAVYDVLGNRVALLENSANKPGGSYKIEFDGSSLTSGIYFLRLTLNGQSVTQKMTLFRK